MIYLRAHHGLCLQQFQGKGYSQNFIECTFSLLRSLQTNPMITVIDYEDNLCLSCPQNSNNLCSQHGCAKKYDHLCLAYSGVKLNDILTWNEYKSLIFQKIIRSNKLSLICSSCQWHSICLNYYN